MWTNKGRMLACLVLFSFAATPIARAQSFCATQNEVTLQDCEALIALYEATTVDGNWEHAFGFFQATDGDPNNDVPISQWLTRDPVEIEGGRVAHVNLWSNNLNGTLPDAICDLEVLRELDLDLNKLTGAIPTCIGNMMALEKLSIRQIGYDLTGSLPESLGNLVNLKELQLPGHTFTGPIPASLGNLVNLEILVLGGFQGQAGNQLEGPIPASLGQLSNLRMLNLEGNRLTGPIPTSLGTLSKLTSLNLRSNDLSGTIPASLGALPLEFLSLSGNELTAFEEGSYDGWSGLQSLLLNSNVLTNLPDLSGTALTFANVSYNHLTFGDLEPLAGLVGQGSLQYAPQDPIPLRQTTENGTIVLHHDAGGGDATTYDWRRRDLGGSGVFMVIEGATSSSYTVTESGEYHVNARNPAFPDLTVSGRGEVEVEFCPVGKTGADCQGIVVNSVRDRSRGMDQDGNVLPGCDTGEMIDRDGQSEPECTLRAAIEYVNTGIDDTTVDFFIPGNSPPVIQLQTALPEISNRIMLEPFTQRIVTGKGVIISGTEAPEDTDGLVITSGGSGSTIKGLTLEGFNGTAILVSNASHTTIEENRIVDNKNYGIAFRVNRGAGESTGNTVRGNVIGTNRGGVGLVGLVHDTIIENNFIGTEQDGVMPLGNKVGVAIIVGPERNIIRNNVISSNQEQGIIIGGAALLIRDLPTRGNVIEANKIGTDQTGEIALPNGKEAISLFKVTGTEVRDNVIAGHSGTGLALSSTEKSIIEGNYIGTDDTGASNLGNMGYGISDSYSQHTSIKGNIIANNGRKQGDLKDGIYIKGGIEAEVMENGIGVALSPNILFDPKPLGNGGCGVRIDRAKGVNIAKNIITANGKSGVCVVSARGTTFISGNQIGLRETTEGPVGNQEDGIFLELGVSDVVIALNNIVFNGQDGVDVFDEEEVTLLLNTITDNNQAGMRATRVAQMILEVNEILRNQGDGTGVHFTASHGVISGNTISDDAGDAITLEDGSTATVANNNIFGNAGMGLNNLTPSVMVTAFDNWWGDASGPGGAGPGAGDAVSAGVDFAGWRDDMVAVVVAAERDEILLPTGEADTVSVFLQNWQARDDMLDLAVSDTEGWLQSPTSLISSLEDSTGAEVRLMVAVPTGTANGTTSTVEVTATSQANADHAATTTFTLIAESAALAQVVVFPDAVEVAPGDTVIFDALGLDQFSRTIEITPTWSATGGEIDENGVYVAGNTTGEFAVTATDPATELSGTARVGNGVPVAVEEDAEVPTDFRLAPNYPNPFNPETTIAFTLPQQTHIRLTVYDVLGREVAILVDDVQPAGTNQTRFDASHLASGIYFYRLTADRFSQTRTMVLLR